MKKILVFSSYGGGGHISATDTLKECLQDEYSITIVYILDEVLGGLDPIKICSFHKYTEEKFYNYCLLKKWTWFINKLYQLANVLVRWNHTTITRIITRYIKQKNPDLVISVVPLFNNALKDSCKECNVPFLLIPTDLDTTSFIKNIKQPIYEKFKLTLPFEETTILNFAHNNSIPSKAQHIAGFPIKANFFNEKNVLEIKNEFNIPSNKPVVLVLMGAAGSNATYYYLATLLKLTMPVHLIMCLGRNELLRKQLEKVKLPDHISISIIGYTNRISDLMAAATLCITKAGTVSMCETIYMNLPLILDNTSTPLVWEKFNIAFIEKYQFGTVVTDYKQLNQLVTKMLLDTDYYKQCKTNLTNFPKKRFGQNIKGIVAELMQ